VIEEREREREREREKIASQWSLIQRTFSYVTEDPEERSSHQKIQQLTTGSDIDLLQFNTIPKLLSLEYFLIIPSKIQVSPETYLRSRFPNIFSQLRFDSHTLSVLGNAFKYIHYENHKIQP
jgi:hypothetical protein